MVRGRSLALVLLLALAGRALALTFTVTTTADTGAGSLRQALLDASGAPGTSTIAFAIPPFDGTVKTIAPLSPLPQVYAPIVIDGYTQDDAHPNTLATGDDAVLRIRLTAGAPGFDGLTIYNGTTVRGLVVGGFGAGGGSGLVIGGGSANAVKGCFIGTDPTGGSTDPNHLGIDVLGGDSHVIGGTDPAARNVVSGNEFSGIRLNALAGVAIQGNFIGTQADGLSPLGNGGNGVGFEFTTSGGPDLVGGAATGTGNVIAYNGGRGVLVYEGMTGVSILGNSIFANTELGIDLAFSGGGVGVSPNDPGDADTGPNNLQNFPILASPMFAGGSSTTGTLNSTPGRTFRIEVFANDACDPSGFGEGKTFVGTVDTGTTDVNGDVGFTVNFGQTIGATLLTATATDLTTGDTSEFSACPVPPTTTTTSTMTTASTSSSTTSSTSAPTTTSTSTSSTTTTVTTTSSTLLVTTSSTSSSTTHTTAAATSTTTTTPAMTCANVPTGPTFASIICRIEALLAQVNAESALSNLQAKLAHTLMVADERATDARTQCTASNAKKSKKRLAQTKQTLGQYVHRLGSKPAHKLDGTLRRTLIGRAQAIEPDLQSLHGTLRCPADAND